jgi:hypothetical protein
MKLKNFKESLSGDLPPDNLQPLLQALWYDAKCNWEMAHEIARSIESEDASWVHAYHHRKEGDGSNASYWYGRAGKFTPEQTLEEEWEEIVKCLLER